MAGPPETKRKAPESDGDGDVSMSAADASSTDVSKRARTDGSQAPAAVAAAAEVGAAVEVGAAAAIAMVAMLIRQAPEVMLIYELDMQAFVDTCLA